MAAWPGLQCRQVKFTSVKSQVIFVQVKSQVTKLATPVRLESTINAVIEGIHVHRSVKLFLVLLRGFRRAPQSLSTARTCTPHARPLLCPCKIPARTRVIPGLEFLVAGAVHTVYIFTMVCQHFVLDVVWTVWTTIVHVNVLTFKGLERLPVLRTPNFSLLSYENNQNNKPNITCTVYQLQIDNLSTDCVLLSWWKLLPVGYFQLID